jgi:serine/threonine protein kinase
MTGLQYLHSHGFLFCDLKPSNVLVDEYGVVKLSDFGLSRRVPSAGSSSGTSPSPSKGKGGSSSGPRKRGTPYYMAPELFLEEGVHSYKSELWSLGCVYVFLHPHPHKHSGSLHKEMSCSIAWGWVGQLESMRFEEMMSECLCHWCISLKREYEVVQSTLLSLLFLLILTQVRALRVGGGPSSVDFILPQRTHSANPLRRTRHPI